VTAGNPARGGSGRGRRGVDAKAAKSIREFSDLDKGAFSLPLIDFSILWRARQKLIQSGAVDAMIAVGPNMF
jgi:hypothetical protein